MKRWSHSYAEKNDKKWKSGGKKDKTPPTDKDKTLALVDQVQEGTVDDYLNFQRDPYMRGYAPADGPDLTVSEREHDKAFPDFTEVRDSDEPTQQLIAKLWRAINARLSNPYKTDIDWIYDLYQALPEPRMSHLHSQIRHKLLDVMGREDKNRISMLRYFEIVADVQRAGLRLTASQWNGAVAFAARWVGHSKDRETDAALRLWKEMEADGDVHSNGMTFNILFDVASKAGNFILAERLYLEMDKRKIPWNRYHHVSLIHFFGLRMDSDGIRAAYKEMVEAGEMIDNTVLNCVIVGFLRCGDEYAALRVYERMKTAHWRAPSMPNRNYMDDKVITKVLMMYSMLGNEAANKHPGQRQAMDDAPAQPGADSEAGAKSGLNADSTTKPKRASPRSIRLKARAERDKDQKAGDKDQEAGDKDQEAGDKGDGGALRKHFQRQSPIIPNLQTYRILLNHYALRLAALDKVAAFLDDMKWFQVPLHGAIFLALFKGFALHGGPGQKWGAERLNTVYAAFQTALKENANGMFMDVWMARWLLRAFRRCETEDRLWEVWAELRPRCEADFEPSQIPLFEEFLIKLMHPDGPPRYSDTGMFGEIDPQNMGRRKGWRD